MTARQGRRRKGERELEVKGLGMDIGEVEGRERNKEGKVITQGNLNAFRSRLRLFSPQWTFSTLCFIYK